MTKNGLVRERMRSGAPLEFAPENEQGVVYLFSHWARENAYRIEEYRPQFPDGIAVKNGKHVRIEFEYRSVGSRCHLNRTQTKNSGRPFHHGSK